MPTVDSTLAACSPPITLMRELGHMNRKLSLIHISEPTRRS